MASSLKLAFPSLLAALALAPGKAGAWGAGHDDIVRAVIERLPEEVRGAFDREVIRAAVTHASHYPDSFEPFDPAEIGEAAVAELNEAGLKVRYELHHDHGRVASFARLVDAFRTGDPKLIAHWIASHSHVIADMAACNHDPLVHTATYGWAHWKVKLPRGGDFSEVSRFLDLSGTARDEAGGKAAFHEAIARFALEDDGRTEDDQVVELILYGQEGARFCAPRGVEILRGATGWVDRGDAEARAALWRNLGELGAWAVARTLRDVAVARRFAHESTRVVLSDAARARADGAIDALLRERRLEEDSLFAPLLRPLAARDDGVIGIVLEPAWDMNDAMLGFSSRVQSASIARTLGKEGRPYATFDLRDLLGKGFPDPGRVPLMIVVATSFNNYRWMKTDTFDAGLAAYLEKGGRVLWVAGTGRVPGLSFAKLVPAMGREDKAKMPLTAESLVGATLSASLPGDPSWQIANTPDTPAGWQRPHCPWRFEDPQAAGLEPLLAIEAEGAKAVVGVLSGDRRIALVPVYALTPHLLDKESPVVSPHEPELDGPSAKIFLGTMERILAAE